MLDKTYSNFLKTSIPAFIVFWIQGLSTGRVDNFAVATICYMVAAMFAFFLLDLVVPAYNRMSKATQFSAHALTNVFIAFGIVSLT